MAQKAPQPTRPASARAVEPRDRFYARTFALLTVLLLGYVLLRIVQPFLGPLLWALFVAFLLHPVHRRITAQLKGRNHVSALLLTIFTFIVVVGPLTALSAAFAVQLGDLLQYIQSMVADPTKANVLNLVNVPWIADVLAWIDSTFGVNFAQIRGWAVEASREMLQSLATMGGRVFVGAIGTVVGFMLMVFMLFFFIRDGEEMLLGLRDLIPMAGDYKKKLFDDLAAVARAMVYGTGLVALIQGALVGISFAIVGLPSPIVFGTLAALASLLPFGGSALVWLPGAIAMASRQQWWQAIFLFVWGALLVSLVDNIVRPLLVSKQAKVGTLTVFIGVLGGLASFGAIGLFLGPVVLALCISLVRFMRGVRRAEAKNLDDAGVGPT
jgi:predicted PurR-regulated permease PerM